MDLIYLFLPMILFLGTITSYEDIKTGKIRNKWLKLALVYSVIINSILFFSQNWFETGYAFDLIINLILMTFFSFILWYYNVWSAGDGKLMIAFSSIIPLMFYNLGYQNWMPSITLVFNTFFIGGLLFIGIIIFKLNKKEMKKSFNSFSKDFLDVGEFFNSLLFFFTIYWLIKQGFILFGINNTNTLVSYAFIYFIILFIDEFKGEKTKYFIAVILIARLILDQSIYSLSFLKEFLILIIIWKIFKSFVIGFLYNLSRKTFSKNVKSSALREGMILGDKIELANKLGEKQLTILRKEKGIIGVYKGKEYFLKPKTMNGSNPLLDEEPEGITKKQIRQIRQMGFKEIRISQTIPFAPFIFIGVMITIIIKGNLLILIRNFLL